MIPSHEAIKVYFADLFHIEDETIVIIPNTYTLYPKWYQLFRTSPFITYNKSYYEPKSKTYYLTLADYNKMKAIQKNTPKTGDPSNA